MTTINRSRLPLNGSVIAAPDGTAREFTRAANALSNRLRQSQDGILDAPLLAAIRYNDAEARKIEGEAPRHSAAYRGTPEHVHLENAVASMRSGFSHVATAFEHEGLAGRAATPEERASHRESAAEARGDAARTLWDTANRLFKILRLREDTDLDGTILSAVRAIDRIARMQYDKKTGHERTGRSGNGGEWKKIA